MGGHHLAYISLEKQSEVSGSLILSLLDQLFHNIYIPRGQRRFFRDFLLPRQPTSSTFISKEYFFDDSGTQLPPISGELHQVMRVRVRENHLGVKVLFIVVLLTATRTGCHSNPTATPIAVACRISR